MGFPFVFGVLGVSVPLFGDTDTTHEADFAVDDEKPSVHALVELSHGVPVGWAKPDHGRAGGPQLFDQIAVHLGAALGVEKHVDL